MICPFPTITDEERHIRCETSNSPVKTTEILLKMATNKTKYKRKLSPTLGYVMGPIFTTFFNDIFHVLSPVLSCQLQCSVRSSLFPFIVFLCLASSVFSDYFLLQLLPFS